MKKYFKSLAKKSLSLFMAVIMLMTCWVWMAPTEAEAANQHDGYYYVEVRAKLDDWDNDENVKRNNWIITHALGTTTLTSASIYNGGQNNETGNYVHAYGWVPAFPTDIKHEFGQKSSGSGCNVSYSGDGWGVRNAAVWVGDGTTMIQISSSTGGYKTTKEEGSYSGTQITTFYAAADVAPYAASVKTTAGLEKKEISVPNLGATNPGSVAFTKAGVYNQYGVKMSDVTEYALYPDNAGTGAEYTQADHGIWVSGTTVYASEKAQKGIPNSSGSQKVYLFAKHGEIKGCIAEITLKYNSYTVTVDSKGSVTASGFNPTITLNNNSTQTGNWSYTGPYSATAATYPNGEATATGYTFKGFWTTKQPTTGDAGIDASEATFATPVSSKDFVDVYGGTAGAEYVEKDGKKYYNAGTQWDGAVHKEILGANTFYGWWIPQDITVKFYDIDGSYLGTKIAKYGSTPAKDSDFYPEPKDGYTAGAMTYQSFAGKWRDANTGAIITEGSYTFGAHAELNLTPVYETKTYNDKYTINFVNPSTDNYIGGSEDGENWETDGNGSGKYAYRYVLNNNDSDKQNIPTDVTTPSALTMDKGYTYVFTGWTTQTPAAGKRYVTVSADDTSFKENTDWVVRGDTTYYPVFRSTVKEYVVAFNYIDSTGADKTETLNVPYGSVISTPDVVNRTYATGGFGYTLEGWTSDAYQNDAELTADGTLVFNETNVFITASNLAPNGDAIVFTADYDDGEPTPYTITFKYKDENGVATNEFAKVYHGEKLTADDVAKLDNVPAQYDDGTALYKFSGKWKVTEGTADQSEYTKDEFTSFAPTSHVIFEAVYGEGTPFYTVTYIDGSNTNSERILAGSNVPAWIVGEGDDAKEYVPAKEKTATGEYTFEGWFDAAQADKDFGETNGTKYTTKDIVNGDLTLYSQFTFSPFKFAIKFVNENGDVFAQGEYIAGASFKAIYDEAMAEAEVGKAADERYSYTFIGWDYKVPDSLKCEGKNITYTAQYRPSYIYYTSRWYNDVDAMNDADYEMEAVGQDGLLAKTSHTYEGKIYAPSVTLTAPDASEGMVNVFKGWKYIDANGEVKDYVRGMQLTADMSFYADYEEVAAETEKHTVTAVVDGKETKYIVVDGEKASIGDPAGGCYDATYHRTFVRWYTVEYIVDGEETREIKNTFNPANTVINSDVTIYAEFKNEKHTTVNGGDEEDFTDCLKEFVSAPTYYAMGTEYVWCACDKEATIIRGEDGKPAPQETIPMLTDTVAPTGTIYLGSQGSWSSTDEKGAAETDNNEVTLYANADTDIVLIINDTGDVNNPYNPTGKGKGIATIQGIISTGVFGADTTEIAGIQTILSDNSEAQNNTANYVIRLGTYPGLVSGQTYIAYYYAKDKAGNVLNKNVRTAKFIYDNEAPVIVVAGDTDGNEKVPTYCGKAVVKGIENGSTVYVNNEKVTLTTSGAAGTSHYEIKEAGNYIIEVTDKAGNTATKKIIVRADHDKVATSQDVTCSDNGYNKVVCTVCQKEISKEIITAEGHSYEAVTVAATCKTAGYTANVCTVCGEEEAESREVLPALEHVDTGRVEKIIKAATCYAEGSKIECCAACGEEIGEAITIAETNDHDYGTTKVLRATCTAAGKEYQQCTLCYAEKKIKDLPALNHENTGRYTVVTTAPTCIATGVETTYCKGCGEEISTVTLAKTAHTLTLVEYTDDTDKSDEYPNGYKQYECLATGCTHTEGKVAITVETVTYTVTFKDAYDNVITTITKNAGESIAAADVADQTKAEDNEYTYTFKGWKGSDGKIIKLPVKVTKNETYTAEFTATKRTYTHTFKLAEGDQTAFATIVGTYGQENKKPAGVPTKDATDTTSYKFKQWNKVGGGTDFTMTGDATFVAEWTETAIKYNVVYLNEGKHFKSETLDGGATHTVISDVPTKAYDNDNHYTFAGWTDGTTDYKAGVTATIEVNADVRFTAKYTAVPHVLVEDADAEEAKAATCTATGIKVMKCECGYEKQVTLPKVEHNYVLQDDGSKVCSGCGDIIAAAAKEFSITFKYAVTGDTSATDTLKVYKVEEGKAKAYTAPEMDATAEFEYKFDNWTDAAGEEISTEATIEVTATADATYIANYTATRRSYAVVYFDANKQIISETMVEYGKAVPAAPADPTKASTDNDHYVFDGWSVAANSIVTGETVITPKFSPVAHTWKEAEGSLDATCTTAGGTKYVCTGCGMVKPGGEKPATGHSFSLVKVVAPTATAKGYSLYKCDKCPETETRDLPDNYYTITVKVLDEDGKPAQDVTVKLFNEEGIEVNALETNAEGIVTFCPVDPDSKYKVYISSTGETKDVSVDKDGKVSGGNIESRPEKVEEDNSCKCACHKGTFWGIIFRLFQKIIKFFTGKASCCSCPDKKI